MRYMVVQQQKQMQFNIDRGSLAPALTTQCSQATVEIYRKHWRIELRVPFCAFPQQQQASGQQLKDSGQYLKDSCQHLKDPCQHLKDSGQNLKNSFQHLKDSGQHLKDSGQHLKDVGQHYAGNGLSLS